MSLMQVIGLGTMCLGAGIGIVVIAWDILEMIAESKAKHSLGHLDGCTFGRYA